MINNKAKAVSVQHKEGDSYGALLTSMGICHKRLQQWSEAVTCYKEAVEHSCNLYGNNHPEYAMSLWNLARLFAELKQFEEAIPRLEEALAIRQRVFGDQHDRTVMAATELARVRQLAAQSDRGAIDVGHNFRMCSFCGAVSEAINTCPCVRAWYCNADCQLQHWPTHKPHCTVCFQCSMVLTNCSLQAGQVLQRSMPGGPLERLQEGVCGADGEEKVIRCGGHISTLISLCCNMTIQTVGSSHRRCWYRGGRWWAGTERC